MRSFPAAPGRRHFRPCRAIADAADLALCWRARVGLADQPAKLEVGGAVALGGDDQLTLRQPKKLSLCRRLGRPEASHSGAGRGIRGRRCQGAGRQRCRWPWRCRRRRRGRPSTPIRSVVVYAQGGAAGQGLDPRRRRPRRAAADKGGGCACPRSGARAGPARRRCGGSASAAAQKVRDQTRRVPDLGGRQVPMAWLPGSGRRQVGGWRR